jgi:hypothetical protein
LATTNDSSPFAEAIPSAVLKDVILSYFALLSRATTIKNLEAKEVKISSIAGIIKKGIKDTSINAPIEIKNIAANTSRIGVVITLATLALFDSATNTPAKKAPVATDRPNRLAPKDNPTASPKMTVKVEHSHESCLFYLQDLEDILTRIQEYRR